ncbi:N-acetylglutamate synthase-like GNAT family acetyltransferase [Pullulanibacillus pueri]|uniref:N-acetyltransferase domain-containing protein n=1 Tax=Pullulanibacillus pueri TaxID=1437324 RepID=A0A8J2ZXE3_9BACL|nr:hypothetical protein [Pullulanibacillus pueri]MBM7681717.1 N-acetylglutamate synthase-like GNAT family acetyltransferase [Pullulanibacillus pueri]GGH84036.1 hypothetical protein GCM10007096_26180 [Pullulanibacillus pueri]
MIREIIEVDAKYREQIKRFIHKVGLVWTPECEDAQFLVMDNKGVWAAVIGIAKNHTHAILRTMVLDPKQCDGDDLMRLLTAAIAKAESLHAEGLYFLTMASADLFEPLGFVEIPFTELPNELQKDPLFTKEKSNSARVMQYTIESD